MAEYFVKTMNCNNISFMPKPDGSTAVKNLAEILGVITNGIRTVHWDTVHHGNTCDGEPVTVK